MSPGLVEVARAPDERLEQVTLAAHPGEGRQGPYCVDYFAAAADFVTRGANCAQHLAK